jgi:hypothetical protein
MYTGQGNKEQVSQDLKDGFLIYMLTTRRPGMFVWCWTKGTLESIVVRFWVQKRRPRDVCLVLDERNTREHSCSVLGTKKRPGIVVGFGRKEQ